MSALAVSPAGVALAARYVGFAVLSMLANLFAQEATVRLVPMAPLFLSVLVGTGTGFVLKYVLDKHLIFLGRSESHGEEARTVVVYGLFSVLTTLVFWGFEFGFYALWGTAEAKYTGAVLGLALGYVIKYGLDRRFMFRGAR